MAQDPKKADPGTADEGKKHKFITTTTEEGAVGATGVKPLINYFTALVHMVKGYVGTGIFAMGESFKFSGHTLGLCLLATIAVMNLHCQHMLIKVAKKVADEEEEEVRPSFSETVEYTMEKTQIEWFRKRSSGFGLATTIFLVMAELGFCCVYFVFISEHLIEIIADYNNSTFTDKDDPKSKHTMLAIILLPMWASTFLGSLKLLMPLSLISNLVMWTGIVMIMYFTFSGPKAKDCQFVSDGKQLHRFFGMSLFAFEGITFIIPLRNEMKRPEKFTSVLGVLNIGMFFVVFLYSLVGFMAYYKYGQSIESSVFLNLPHKDKLAQATKGLISFGVMLTFTLHMYIPFEISYPLFHRKYGPFKHEFLAKAIYRTVPVLVTFTLANAVPFLGLFISIIGATTGAMLALIIPPILELIAFKGQLHVAQVIKDAFIAFVGIVALLLCTVLSLIDLVNEFIKSYSSKK